MCESFFPCKKKALICRCACFTKGDFFLCEARKIVFVLLPSEGTKQIRSFLSKATEVEVKMFLCDLQRKDEPRF